MRSRIQDVKFWGDKIEYGSQRELSRAIGKVMWLDFGEHVHKQERPGFRMMGEIQVLWAGTPELTHLKFGIGYWKIKRTDFIAIACHLANSSETERMMPLAFLVSLRWVIRLWWRRKSAGDESSSVIRRRIPSGRLKGDSISLATCKTVSKYYPRDRY